MRIARSLFPVLLAALVLSSCASVVLAPAGPHAVGKGQQVTLGRDWTDMSVAISPPAKKVRLLTIDGPLLNRLYLTEGLGAGERLGMSYDKQKPTPAVRAGMSATERIEFVSDSVAALGYLRVETARPRPAKVGEAAAIRFDLDAQTSDGLDIRGTALVAEQGGKLYVILYLAPAEHYFQANLGEVEAIMASARIVG